MSELLGDRGPTCIWTMWMFTIVSLVFVLMRLYTRKFVVDKVGLDDYVYTLSWICLLLYTIFVTLAALQGYGRHINELPVQNGVNAIYIVMIGQTFAVLGMAIAKVSLSLFLLRIVVLTWHKAVLWFAMISIMAISVAVDIIFWVQCTPTEYIYDKRVDGECTIGVKDISLTLGSWCVFEDFLLAIFPWFFLWSLQMKRKEKMTIAGGLSLGIVAGMCGIFRTTKLTAFGTADYTYDTVDLMIWSAAEQSLTLLCIAIPVLRPLYKVVMNRGSSTDGYYPSASNENSQKTPQNYPLGSVRNKIYPGQDVVSAQTSINKSRGENASDESILGPEYREHGIKTTTQVTVSYKNKSNSDLQNYC